MRSLFLARTQISDVALSVIGEFCASLTEECGPLPPPPPPPKPAAIIIAGPRAIARPVGDTMRRSASYLAEVVDQ